LLNIAYLVLGLSFLNPNTSLPWINFQQEFLAIFSLFLLVFYGLKEKEREKFKVPNGIIYTLIFIFICVFFQYLLGFFYFKQDVILFLLYFCIFIIVCIISYNFDLKILNLFKSLIIISLISVFIQLLQWFDFQSLWLRTSYFNRPSGNLGQPNQLSTFLFMGLYSLSYIRKENELNTFIYLCVSFFIIFGIALTDSRTAWLVLFLSLIIVIFRDKSEVKYLLLKITFYIISIFTIKLINKKLIINSNFEIRNLESLRLYNWNQLFEAIIERPYFGYGVNQTTLAQSIVSEKVKSVEYLTYAHNILIDLFLWFGLPIGLVIFTGCFFLFYIKYYCNKELDTYIFLILSAFIVHCNLEYPFTYAYFLIPVGIILGSYYKGEFTKINKIYFINFIYIVYLFLVILCFEYFLLKKQITDLIFENRINNKSQTYTYRIIDALSFSEIYKFKNYCNVSLKYKEKEHFENVYYRYPYGRNIYLYAYSSIYANNIDYKLKKYLSYQVKDVDKTINIMSQKVANCE